MKPWVRRTSIAFGCILALLIGAGGWILHANDFEIRQQSVTIPGPTQPLHATLALPETGDGPFGLVVFVHGDGPADASRDSYYTPIWETFAAAGYASLSWNKPGVDGAPGNWLDQSMHDRALEAEAAIAWARERSDIDPRRVGVWGISQAGWVVPEVAVHLPDLQFVILVGPAVNWLRRGEFNTVAEMRHANASEADIADALQRRNAGLQSLRENATYRQYLATQQDSDPMTEDRWNFVVRNYRSDATADLSQIAVPVLLVLGDEDLNVDVDETEQIYRDALPPDRLTVRRFADASHSIVDAGIDNDKDPRGIDVALFAPRSLYAPGYLIRSASS